MGRQLSKSFFDLQTAKVSFAFSSGFFEIEKVIDFLSNFRAEFRHIQLRFRTHKSYSITRLNTVAKYWIEKNNIQISDTNTILIEDLEWADITVYISSAVALESIYVGVSVIHLDIDTLNSDPLLSIDVANKWQCSSRNDFFTIISEIASLSKCERVEKNTSSGEYVRRYSRRSYNKQDYEIFYI